MRLAGEVRNLDVAMECLHKWHIKDHDSLAEQRQQAAGDLATALDKWVDRGLAAQLKEDLGLHSLELAAIPIERHAREMLSAMAADFFHRGNDAADPRATPQQMHGFRISAKKFRYSMELFAHTYGHTLNSRIEKVRHIQSILGEINDCVTLRGMISGDHAGGRLLKRQNRKVEEFRRHWSSHFAGSAIMRGWVDELALLSLRKGPQRERECRHATVRFVQAGRRRSTGG